MQSQDITCLAWAKLHQLLAAATKKGSLVLFSVAELKREVFVGKHSRAITCADWSNSGLLAMAGLDNQARSLFACPKYVNLRNIGSNRT